MKVCERGIYMTVEGDWARNL